MTNVTVHSWYEKFSCVGGACPMTCCNAKSWGIKLEKKDIDKFEKFDEPFRSEVFSAIDFENKKFKSKKDVFGNDGPLKNTCALMTNEGWCKIVLNYGEENISDVCHIYPRHYYAKNNIIEKTVSISCPIAAEYLLDDTKMEFKSERIDYNIPGENFDEEKILALKDVRDYLIDLFVKVDGFEAGKCFVTLGIINGIKNLIETGNLNRETIENILLQYSAEEVLENILLECEQLNSDVNKKTPFIKMILSMSEVIAKQIPEITYNWVDNIENDIKEWSDESKLGENFAEFLEYRKREFPDFVNRYMAYRLFSAWINDTDAKFGDSIKVGYYVLMLMELAAMSYWKHNEKKLSYKEFSFIIAAMDRSIFHHSKAIEIISTNLDTIEKKLNLNLFMIPAY